MNGDGNATKPKRRAWTPEQKRKLVEESRAPGSSIAAVARANGLHASNLCAWSKKLSLAPKGPAVKQRTGLLDRKEEYTALLTSIDELNNLVSSAVNRLTSDMSASKLNSYNLSCAIANLVNARTKVTEQRLQILERLEPLLLIEQEKENVQKPEFPIQMQRQAEKLLVALSMREQFEKGNRLLACQTKGS